MLITFKNTRPKYLVAVLSNLARIFITKQMVDSYIYFISLFMGYLNRSPTSTCRDPHLVPLVLRGWSYGLV